MDDFFLFARDVVREAGDFAQALIHRSELLYVKSGDDFVTNVDLQVESRIATAIAEAYPDHGIISEEKERNRTDADYVWILDPIDGTKYFSRRLPLYSISLALRFKGEPVLGVVHCPALAQTFTAEAGGGAKLNGESIRCSEQQDLAGAIVSVELPNRRSPKEEREWAMERLGSLIDNTMRVRSLHVASLALCWCATGGFDAHVGLCRGIEVWDIAAGQIVLTEAGGAFSTIGGCVVAGSPVLHDKLVDLLDLGGAPFAGDYPASPS